MTGIISFIQRIWAVCKWNVVSKEKAEHRFLLSELCLLNENNEFALHHEFWKSLKNMLS